jgi:hypothetical protein
MINAPKKGVNSPTSPRFLKTSQGFFYIILNAYIPFGELGELYYIKHNHMSLKKRPYIYMSIFPMASKVREKSSPSSPKRHFYLLSQGVGAGTFGEFWGTFWAWTLYLQKIR